MTIASQTSRINYVGNGATTAFSVPFYFAANADLVVYLQDTSGNQTLQTLGTHYNLTGATLAAGGTCTFVTAPTAITGAVVTIYRDPALTQTTSYNNNDPFPAKSHELALDKLTTITQRLKDQISRTVHQTEGEGTMTTTLATIAARKNKLLGFGTSGELVYATGPTYVAGTYVGVAVIDSRGTAVVTTIPVSTTIIETRGYTTPGDGGGATYKRVGSQPSHAGKFQSADGAWWEIASDVLALRMFGVVGDATGVTGAGTNDTTAIQNAFSCAASLGKKLTDPNGLTMRTTAPITWGGRIYFDGTPCSLFDGTDAVTGVGVRGDGTWFFFDHSGVGLQYVPETITGVTAFSHGNILTHFGTMRAQPAPGLGWVPGVFDWDIEIATADILVNDVAMLNPTKGLRIYNGNYGRLSVNRLRGQPLSVGLEITNAYDVCRVENVHFWTFWNGDTSVIKYTSENATAIYSKRNDNPIFANNFFYGYRHNIRIGYYAGSGPTYPAGTTYNAKFMATDCDLTGTGVTVDSDSVACTAQFHGITITGRTGLAVETAGVNIGGTFCHIDFFGLATTNIQRNGIWVQNASNRVNVTGYRDATVDQFGSGNAVILAEGTDNIVEMHGDWNYGSTAQRTQTGGTSAVRARLGRSFLTGQTTDASGDVTITHGLGVAPSFVALHAGTTLIAHLYAHTINSTTFKVRVMNAAGAAIVSTGGINFGYEAFSA